MAAPNDDDVSSGASAALNTRSDKPSYPIGSVDSALRLLLLVAHNDRVRVVEAATELGVSPSTAHRLMAMLVYHGLVRQDAETKAYSAGPELISLGLHVTRKLDVATIAHPIMNELAAEFSETVHFFVLQPRGAVLCLDSVESTRGLRIGSRVGALLAAFASSSGRALLSTMPVDEVKALYPGGRLPQVQPGTIHTRAQLLLRLEEARRVGYAVQYDESEPGVSAVSAPVRVASEVATFALTIALPTSRVRENLMSTYGESVSRAAGAIARRIGV